VEGVDVRAVKTTRGRAATTVHVELDPERLPGAAAPREVVAALPTDDGDGSPVRWEEQPLREAGEGRRGDGKRSLRYSGTRYEGSDAGRYGIKVRVRTDAGQVSTGPEGTVREADEPEDS
jgi:hypothetical protein